MFNAQYFSPQYFHSLSWRFDFREQTITYARVAAHIGERQAVAFAFSQDSLRAACKVDAKSTVISVEHVVALIKRVQHQAAASSAQKTILTRNNLRTPSVSEGEPLASMVKTSNANVFTKKQTRRATSANKNTNVNIGGREP